MSTKDNKTVDNPDLLAQAIAEMCGWDGTRTFTVEVYDERSLVRTIKIEKLTKS